MAAINPPGSPSIPLDIRKELVNPFTPWEVSQELFGRLQAPAPDALYKKVEVLPTSKEWRFIWRYFFHLKPLRYTIKRIYFIYERHQQQTFVSTLSSIEREAVTFPPTWDQESRADLRTRAIERWKETAQIFSPFTTQEQDGRVRNWEHTKVLPLWHGTNAPICDSICTSGFVFFGKAIIPGAAGAPPQSTDDGYFGSGIYFTNSARYAADIYSKGHLLLGWVSMREPFPVVGDPNQTDMATLRGKGAYKNYNAHYVPVASLDPGNPYCAVYHPVQADQNPTCDEYVVFHKSQALPQYWVELEVELPYIQVPGDSPEFVNELIPHLMKILEHPKVDRDQRLRDFLGQHLAALLVLPPNWDLSPEQVVLYEQITQLITPQGINKPLRNQMVGAAPPQLPFAQVLPGQEEKEPPLSKVESQQSGAEEKEPTLAGGTKHQVEPQPIAKPVAAKPSAEKTNMLRAVWKNGEALKHASEELKNDREVVLAAVQNYGFALKHASEELKNDREIVLAAIKQCGHALAFASNQLKGDREIVLAAVLKGGRHILEPNWKVFAYASKELKGDRQVVLTAVQQNGQALSYASEELRGDWQVVLYAVQKSGWALAYASEELKGYRNIVLAAVRQCGYALQFASVQLKGDREIVLAAVQQEGNMLGYASAQLQADREIVLAAVQQHGYALKYASNQLKDDRKIVLAAVQQNGDALKYASTQLQADREIVLAAVQQVGGVLQYASEQLKNDKKIVLAAVKKDKSALQYASEQLQADKKIRRAAGLQDDTCILS